MPHIAVITGAGAGVGRAAAREFAARGYDVALLSRDPDRLESAARECHARGVSALVLPTDVADAQAVEAAAERTERELGPITVWVNVAMATIFAPLERISADEFARATAVTYLGQVYGTMAALKRMRARNRGSIINVGSALAYRAIPLQSAYCGAKFAIRGFTDSLRSEILHDRLNVHVCMVDLPAMNTPQFDWALNKMGKKAQPLGTIFQPEVAARAIYFASRHRRRNVWVGWSTVKSILADRIAPGLLDHYLARVAYDGQLSSQSLGAGASGNLFEPVKGAFGAHGRFGARAASHSPQLWSTRHRVLVWLAAAGLAVAGLTLSGLRSRR